MKNIFLIIFISIVKIVIAQVPNYRIEFSAAVDKLNLRAEPNTNSRIIQQIPKGDGMIWLQEMTNKDETVKWKGKDEHGRWFKVRCFSSFDSLGWVFEKGINVKEINLRYDEIKKKDVTFDSAVPYENYWIKIEPSSANAFSNIKELPRIRAIVKKNNFKKDSVLTLPLSNGKKVFYRDFTDYDESESSTFYQYEGEINEINCFIVNSSIFINRNNEISATINLGGGSFSDKIIRDENDIKFEKYYNFSPLKTRCIFPLRFEPGDMMGMSHLKFSTSQSTEGVNISGFNTVKEFRWIDDNSGIATYLDNTNEGKLIYTKFTFKKL